MKNPDARDGRILREARTSGLGLILGGLAVMCLGLTALLGQFRYESICTRCGSIRSSTDFQVPWTRLTYASRHRIEPTRLALGWEVVPHEHAWAFAEGAGPGVQCAIGEGTWLREPLRSAVLARFLAEVARDHGSAAASLWLERALDPRGELPGGIDRWLRRSGFPPDGHASAAELRTWITQAAAGLRVEVPGEADRRALLGSVGWGGASGSP